ncbi:MAG: hypothetical protein GXO23_00125 [Crenarchaeota archaeon]|nr:hypothetical protein [Thermoproteota archaeon]
MEPMHAAIPHIFVTHIKLSNLNVLRGYVFDRTGVFKYLVKCLCNVVGLFSVYAFDEAWNVSKIIYYGLLALNHRGQAGSGMYICGGESRILEGGGDVERAYNVEKLIEVEGWYGAGWVSTPVVENRNVVYRHHNDTEYLVVSYAPIVDMEERIMECIERGFKDVDEGAELLNSLSEKVRRPLTLIAVSNNSEMLIYRDPSGLKPLQIGAYGFDLAVASSESCAIECVGADFRADVDAGSCVKVCKYCVERSKTRRMGCYCALEYIYYSRLDSTIDGVQIYRFRRELARKVAERYQLKDYDIVVGIPETGTIYALEYSRVTGLEYYIGFVQTGRRVRSALVEDILERMIGVQLKMSPIRPVLSGKNVLLIDDSMLKGVTLRSIVQYLRNRVGTCRTSVLIMSPPIVRRCPFYMEVPEESELICANVPKSELAEVLNVDEIHFAEIDDLYETFKLFNIDEDRVCTYCMGGRSPW